MSVRLERSVEDKRKIWNLLPPTRKALARVRLKALRCGVWFKELSRDERMFMELVISVTDRVRSFLLAKVLGAIVTKLSDAMESRVARFMREVGRGLAEKLSRIAQSWGNKSAHHWTEDPNFLQYLAVNHMNMPAMYKA